MLRFVRVALLSVIVAGLTAVVAPPAAAASLTLSAPANGLHQGPGSYGLSLQYTADRETSGCVIPPNANVFRIAYKKILDATGAPVTDDFHPIAQTVENHLETTFLTAFGTWQVKAYFGCTVGASGAVEFVESPVHTIVVKNTLDGDGDGVQDVYDNCPFDVGTVADQGCPTGVPPVVSDVALKPKNLKPGKKVEFNWYQNEKAGMTILLKLLKEGHAKKVGQVKVDAVPGENDLVFKGKVKGKRLAAGRYQAVMRATDTEGLRSKSKNLQFKILR